MKARRQLLAHELCLLLGVATAAPPIIGGQGNFRYEYMPDKLVMPAGAKVLNSHGLAVDYNNRIYLTYEPDHTSDDKNCLVKWEPDGTDGKLLGPGATLSTGTPHGLRLSEEDSELFLYHANNDAVLHKTTMDGKIVWSVQGPPNNDTKFTPYRPTWFATPPESPFVWMADGYGSNLIHVFTRDGKYTGNTFGGAGTAHGKFMTCHSVNYDPRVNKLVVTDRENHRHEWFDFDPASPSSFNYSSTLIVPELERPCNIRFENGQGFAVVPALEGPVGILDPDNKLVSLLNVTDLIGHLGHLHPHDAIFLPNGDLVVCTWNPGRISYWRRLPPQ